jgi:FAD/FMN-containing dehydrogenase
VTLGTRHLGELRIDPERQCVLAGAGTTWRRIVDGAFDVGLLPPGLTLVVDTTIAGTLSVGGVGGESFSIGAQVNNVLYLDVVTVDGQELRCSPEENRELYDAVRAGLGQCGVVIRAAYPLRRCRPRLRTYFFTYDDAAAFVEDLCHLQREPRSDLVLAFVMPSDEGRMSIMLALGKEFESQSELDDGAMAVGLHHRKQLASGDASLWNESGIPGHVFFRMHTGNAWYRNGAPERSHPWVDHLFTPERATWALDRLLAEPPAPLRMGTCGLIPVAASGHAAPLFALPGPEALHIGIGMFPNVPAVFKTEAALSVRLRRFRRG